MRLLSLRCFQNFSFKPSVNMKTERGIRIKVVMVSTGYNDEGTYQERQLLVQ